MSHEQSIGNAVKVPEIVGNCRDIFCPVPFPLSPFDLHRFKPPQATQHAGPEEGQKGGFVSFVVPKKAPGFCRLRKVLLGAGRGGDGRKTNNRNRKLRHLSRVHAKGVVLCERTCFCLLSTSKRLLYM